jgi:hypothetical protein
MEEIDPIAVIKGKISLAEALKQIETVSNAFKQAEKIEKKQQDQETLISSIKSCIDTLSSYEYVDSKLEEYKTRIESLITQKFQDFSSDYLSQLSEKLKISDIEPLLSQKVTWASFNNYLYHLNTINSKLDKHVLTDFENFKTKIKIEMSHKADKKKTDEEINPEDVQVLKNRLGALELKFQEMFLEDEVDESDDSQEAMDNVAEDKAKDKVSDEMNENSEDQDEIQRVSSKLHKSITSTTQYTESKNQFSLPKFNLGSYSPDASSPRLDNYKAEEVLPGCTDSNTLQNYNTDTRDHENKGKVIKSDIDPEQTTLSPEPKSRDSIEIEKNDQTAPKLRNTGSLKPEGQTLTRKNSLSSSIGNNLGGNSNIKAINKKLQSLQKDFEKFKLTIEDFKQSTSEIKSALQDLYTKIEKTQTKYQETELKLQTMETSFIKSIRRNGIDKKNKTPPKSTNSIDSSAVKLLQQQISDKAKKIESVCIMVQKISTENNCIKDKQKGKINEIVKSLKFLDEARLGVLKQLDCINGELKTTKDEIKSSILVIETQLKSMQGPIADLISDQQRENSMLAHHIKTHQKAVKDAISKLSIAKTQSITIPSSTFPDLSIKYKLSSPDQFRKFSMPTTKNWLQEIPIGAPLALPRIRQSSSLNKSNCS